MGAALTSRGAWLASAFAAAAVALPCGAYWIAGSRESRREADAIAAAPALRAAETAARLAAHVGARLAEIRRAETDRPYFHYQNLYHDPRGASAGYSVTPSPLADGPGDSWLRGYFQIDGRGRVRLPTLPDEGASKTADPDQERLRDELQPLARRCRTLIELPPLVRRAAQPAPDRSLKAAAGQQQLIPRDAYVQNQMATQLFQSLNSDRPPPASLVSRGDPVVVTVGAFAWRSLPTPSGPALVALRPVATPDDVLVQGVIVSPERIAASLASGDQAARVVPGTAGAPIALDGEAWSVVVEPGPDAALAATRAAAVVASFRRRFALVLVFALATGVAAVAVTWRAEQLAAQRSALAAAAAHELRTPLAGLRLHAEMLELGLGEPARRAAYAHRIAAEAARLGRVVTNLLGFARLERGGLRIDAAMGDLGAAVAACVERQRPALEGAGLAVELSVAATPPVAFDADAVEQILVNLLDNAEKYSRGAPSRSASVAVVPGPDAVVLEVRNSGSSLTGRAKRRLFRPFARAAGPDAPAGLGLGLALVRELARAHGGDATVASDADATTVRVSFPIAPRA